MKKSKTFNEIVKISTKTIKQFEKVERRKWGAEGALIELQKQVGELSKNIMSYEGYYGKSRDKEKKYLRSKDKIADELSDILFMTIRIANHYKIDLEKEHIKQMVLAQNHPYMKNK